MTSKRKQKGKESDYLKGLRAFGPALKNVTEDTVNEYAVFLGEYFREDEDEKYPFQYQSAVKCRANVYIVQITSYAIVMTEHYFVSEQDGWFRLARHEYCRDLAKGRAYFEIDLILKKSLDTSLHRGCKKHDQCIKAVNAFVFALRKRV